MNKTFREVTAGYRKVVTLNHTQRVTRLYRKSLRTLESWAVMRDIINEEAAKIRQQFDAAKTAEPGLAQRLLREGEEKLADWSHPDMYTRPYMPGGSKFMRHVPPPLEVMFPDGVPAEYNVARQDVHYIQVPLSAYPEGMSTVLVDPMQKKAE